MAIHIIFNSNGEEISRTDTCSCLAEAQAERIAILKLDCECAILSKVPLYKQINIGKNMMPADEELELVTWMQNCIASYESAKQAVKDATTNEDVYNVHFNLLK